MPFSFPKPEFETSIPFERRDVPFFEWGAERFNQATTQTAGRRLWDFAYETLFDDSPVISAEEATKRYGIPEVGFQFDEPVREETARGRNERKKREMLYQSNAAAATHSGWGWKAWGTFPFALAGQLTDPLELAINAIPFVGVGSKAAGVARLGGATVGRMAERGVITSYENLALSGVRFPVLTGRIIEATAGNVIAEIPVAIQNIRDQADYTLADSLMNIGMGGLVTAGIRGVQRALEVGRSTIAKASEATHEKAFSTAQAQVMRDQPIDIGHIYSTDRAVHLEQMRFDETKAMREALADPQVRDAIQFEAIKASSDVVNKLRAGDIDGAIEAVRSLPLTRDVIGAGVNLSNSIGALKDAIGILPDIGRIEVDGRPLNQWIETVETGKNVEPTHFEKRSAEQLREIAANKRIPERLRKMAAEAAEVRKANEAFAPGSPAARSYEAKVKSILESKKAEFDTELRKAQKISEAKQELASSPKIVRDEDITKIKSKERVDDADVAAVKEDADIMEKDLDAEFKRMEEEAKALDESDPVGASLVRDEIESMKAALKELDEIKPYDKSAIAAAVECVINSP